MRKTKEEFELIDDILTTIDQLAEKEQVQNEQLPRNLGQTLSMSKLSAEL